MIHLTIMAVILIGLYFALMNYKAILRFDYNEYFSKVIRLIKLIDYASGRDPSNAGKIIYTYYREKKQTKHYRESRKHNNNEHSKTDKNSYRVARSFQ